MRISHLLKVLFLLIAIKSSFFSLANLGSLSIPFIKNYTTQDYKAGIQNFALGQDKRGVIYAGNNYGLIEFDGTTWRTFGVSNGTKVRSLAVHANGRIYVGAQNQFGFFFPNERGLLDYFSLSDQLNVEDINIDEVWHTYIIGENVFFCTLRNIYRYDGEKTEIIQTHQPIEFSFLVNNQLFIQATESGLVYLDNREFKHVAGSEIFVDKQVVAIVPMTKTNMLVATINHGLYLYNGSRFILWNSEINQSLKGSFINTVLVLSDGHLAIGTANQGLYLVNYNGEIIFHLNKDGGLNNRTVLSLMEDDYGNIWAGQSNGLAKIEYSSPFTFVNENSGLQGTGYCSYYSDDGLYLGTNNGLFKFNAKESLYDKPLKFIKNSEGQVYSIGEFKDQLLIGHHKGGFVISNGQAKSLSGLPGAWRYLIPKNNPDVLLEGTYYGFRVYQSINNDWKNPISLANFEESSRVFEEGHDGTLWMTHGYKGVYRIQPSEDYKSFNEIKYYGQNSGFFTNQLINVYRISNELVFSTGHGVYSFDKESDEFILNDKFTKLFGEDVRISALEEDAMGNVYFMSAGATGVLSKDRFGEYSANTKIFNKIQRLLNDDLPNIVAYGHGQVLFGAKDGFIHYNASKQTKLLKPIQTLLRTVIATNTDSLVFGGNFLELDKLINEQPENQAPIFSHEDNSLLFGFSSTFTDELVNTMYSYKLEGFDKNWSDWTDKNEKEYTNLREGKYRFLVKAKNIYETESNTTSYSFTISPPWYRTPLATFGFFALVMGLIGGILFSQSTRHKKEKRHLTLIQERELIQKDHKLQEFSKKTEAEIVTLRNEKLAFEVNTKNKELASSTMNLINKNKFLSDLKDSMSLVIQEGKSGENKKIRDMMKRIDKNMAGDSEWEHFQNHFDQVHGDFSQRLIQVYPKLSPQDMKLSTYLRMNLSTKEIAQLLNITVRGVEIARYRLRKKLELNREDNLTEFILGF